MSRCRCGHPAAAHQHYRRGADCSLCYCAGFVRHRPPTRGPIATVVLAVANTIKDWKRRHR